MSDSNKNENEEIVSDSEEKVVETTKEDDKKSKEKTSVKEKTNSDDSAANQKKTTLIIEAAVALVAILAIVIAIIMGNKGPVASTNTVSFDAALNRPNETTNVSINVAYGAMPAIPNYILLNPITEEEALNAVTGGELIRIDMADGSFVCVPDLNSQEFLDSLSVSNDEVMETINYYIASQNAQQIPITDRDDVQDGDTVSINYVGKIDDVAFEGGTGEYDLTIGSGQFIPGFEEQLIGAKVGETVSVNVTFPENYGNEELNGKAAVFTVSINSLLYRTEYPEVTDEMVASFFALDGRTAITTLDACVTLLSEDIKNAKISEYIRSKYYANNVDVDAVVAFYNDSINYFDIMAEQYGMNLMDLVDANGMSIEEIKNQAIEGATQEALYYRCIQAIAESKGITVDDADIQAYVKAQGFNSEAELKEYMQYEDLFIYVVLENKVYKSFY